MYNVGDLVEWDTVVGPTRGHIEAVKDGQYIIHYGPWDDVTTCPCHTPQLMRLVSRGK
jgi:hypothetical protein